MSRTPLTETDKSSDPYSSGPFGHGRLLVLGIALLLVGINMRPAIVAVSPLLDVIRASTGIANSVAGVLTTLPLVCFGIFAPLAPRLGRRFGMERTLIGVLLLLLAGIAIRLAPDLAALFVGTALIGTAVAVANVVVTAIIKRDFGHRVGLMSGLHTTMLVGGAALAAGLTTPISGALGLSWRSGLAMWGVLTLLAAVVWLPQLASRRSRGQVGSETTTARKVWTSKLAWNVALFYAFQSIIYYTATTWLSAFYVAHGFSRTSAGWLLAVCFGCAILTAVTTPLLAERSARPSYLAITGGALCVAAVVGLLLVPSGGAIIWSALLGLGLGDVLSLGITFMSIRASGTHEAGLLSAMSQCVGYLIAALGPVLFGLARDVTGGWTFGLVALGVLVVPMTITGVAACRGGNIVSSHAR